MARWHLNDLETRLAKSGWRIARILEGDDYWFSAGWEIVNYVDDRRVVIDF